AWDSPGWCHRADLETAQAVDSGGDRACRRRTPGYRTPRSSAVREEPVPRRPAAADLETRCPKPPLVVAHRRHGRCSYAVRSSRGLAETGADARASLAASVPEDAA